MTWVESLSLTADFCALPELEWGPDAVRVGRWHEARNNFSTGYKTAPSLESLLGGGGQREGNNSMRGMFNVLYVNLPEIKTSGL